MIRALVFSTFNTIKLLGRPTIPGFLFSSDVENEGSSRVVKCFNCGGTGHMSRECTQEKICRYCKNPGHDISACPSKPERKIKCYNCQQ